MNTMQPNSILAEIRHTRDEMARAADYDVKKFMDAIRKREHTSAAQGTTFTNPMPDEGETCIIREDPPKA